MLPQPDSHVLAANPQFAALYSDLEKNRICANGSSRVLDPRALKERTALEEALHAARVEEAKKEILRDSLRTVGYRGDGLPEELQQVVQIVSAQLEGKIDNADRDVVDGELEYFMEEISNIVPAISNHIEHNLAALLEIADPNSSQEGGLQDRLKSSQSTLYTTRANLSKSRTSLATQTTTMLALYTQLFESLIRIMEQVLHGSVARHTRAQAAYLAVVAEGMEKKFLVLRAQVMNQVYDRATRDALADKMEEVEMEGRRVMSLLRRREGLLGELESKGRGLEKVVEDVKAVREEIEKVREEVERLESGM